MTQLAELRSELRSLGARRRRTHTGAVLLVGAAALVAALVTYYLCDRLWALNVPSRVFVNLLLLGGLGWFAIKKLLPTLLHREDEIDAALRLQRRRGIDSDLVAALQFESAEADAAGMNYFGSAMLTRTVVNETARSADDWRVREEPLDASPRGRRLGLYAVLLLGLIVFAVQPRHAAVFAQRVLLSYRHYPTRTQIDELKINAGSALSTGTALSAIGTPGIDSPRLVVPLGRPMNVELQTSGVLPERATIELVGSESDEKAVIELTAVIGRTGFFQGVLPAPVESMYGHARAGDAFTERFYLTAVPLPAVTVTLEVTPPPYAADVALELPAPGRLYASVLEGSEVAIRVDGANKALDKVELTSGDSQFELEPIDGERRAWRLDTAGTDFAAVGRPLEFTIDVVDADGFALLEPLRGSLALRADQPPSVTADVVTKFVLPTGKPNVLYQASDDLGVQSLAVERQVLRLDGSVQTDVVPVPITSDAVRTGFAGKFPLELASLQLHKGDKVTVRLQARDRRRDDDGRATAQSEPLVLEVTDEPGLYQAMAETDQRSALKMDEIIQKQLLMTGKAGSGGTQAAPPRPANTGTPTTTPTSTTPIPPAPSGTGAKP